MATWTINVTFAPTAGGNHTATITLTDNTGTSPQTVTLTGTGEDYTLTVPSGSSSTATGTPGQAANYSLSFSGLSGLNQSNGGYTGGPPGTPYRQLIDTQEVALAEGEGLRPT